MSEQSKMTNKEAFRKWRTDYESDYDTKPSYLEVWQAAIAYMQEQSEPVGYVSQIPIQPPQAIVAKANDVLNIPVYSTTQIQQPLKRLDEDRIDDIFNSYSDEQGYVAIDDWHLLTNAIMNAMQELNK